MQTTRRGKPILQWLLALACVLPLPAWAQPAVTTQAVNVRSGPDRGFPLVTWWRAGTHVTVFGCTHGWRWCDVAAGRDRGWVYARYLSMRQGNRSIPVFGNGARLGIALIPFVLGSYWDSHYRNRPWWNERDHWASRPPTWQPQPRPPIVQPPRPPQRTQPPPFGPPPAGRPPTGSPPRG